MCGVRHLGAAFMAQLRRVRGVDRHDPAAVLSGVVGEPLDECASVPPAVLHGVHDPAQIFYRDDGITPQVRQVCYLLRRQDSQLAFLAGCGFAVELRLVQRRHACLSVMQQRRSLPAQGAYLPLRGADAVPERVYPLGERRLVDYPPGFRIAYHDSGVIVDPHVHADSIVPPKTGQLDYLLRR